MGVKIKFDCCPSLSGVGKCPPKKFFFSKFLKIFFIDRGHQGDTETEILKFLSHTINVLGAVKIGKSGGKSKISDFRDLRKLGKSHGIVR